MKRDPSTQLDRRNFVLAGLTGVAAAAASSLPALGDASGFDRVTSMTEGSGAFGYWIGSSNLPAFQELQIADGFLRLETNPDSDTDSDGRLNLAESSRIVAAEALPRGSHELRNKMAEVAVHGIYSADEKWPDEFSAISLSSRFEIPVGTKTQTVDFLAWRMDNHWVLNEGDPIRFVAPVNHDSGLSFLVETCRRDPGKKCHSTPHSSSPEEIVQNGGAGERTTTPVTLLSGTQSGRPKLRRGVYFVNCEPSSDSSPFSWNDYRIRAVEGSDKEALFRIEHKNPLSGSSDLRLLVLSVDVSSPSTG